MPSRRRLLVGMNALRTLPGNDVTKQLIDAYPSLPPPAQLALIPILGGQTRRLRLLPLLEQLARFEPGGDAPRRAARRWARPTCPRRSASCPPRQQRRRCGSAGDDSRDHRSAQAEGDRDSASATLRRRRATPICWDCWESSAAGGSLDRSTWARRMRDGRPVTSASPT